MSYVSRRAALAEDLRKLGLAVLVASIVGGYLQDQVQSVVAILGGLLGVASWLTGPRMTAAEEDTQ